MDLGSLSKKLEHKFIREKIDSLPLGSHRRFTVEQEAKIAERHKRIGDGFQKIFELTDATPNIRGSLGTPKIVLGRAVDDILGEGQLTAVVFGNKGRGLNVEVFVHFTTEVDDHILAMENWNHSSGDVSLDKLDYFELERLIGSIKAANDAEETQAMLWEAIRNPELNPELAERAAALQPA